MKAFDLQVTGSLVVTGSIKTTDGTFILSGSDSNASSSFSSRITTNESNMTLATASIAALTASISRLNTEISTDDTDMNLATASIAAITSSISSIRTDMTLATASITSNETNMTLATASIALNESNMTLATASIAAITASLGQPVNTDSNVTFNNINSTGTITAVEVHTTFVSSSIAVASGSNNFGDEDSDHHSFTGSLSVSGSVTVASAGDLFVNENIRHLGDTDTRIRFLDDNLVLYAGNENHIDISTSGVTFGEDILVPEYIKHVGDTDTFMRFTDNTVSFAAGNTTPLVLAATGGTGVSMQGNVAIGDGHTPTNTLHIKRPGSSYTATSLAESTQGIGFWRLQPDGTDENSLYASSISGYRVALQVSGSSNNDLSLQPFAGKVVIGATSPITVVGFNPPKFSVEGTAFTGVMSVIEHQNDISGGVVTIGKSRGTSTGAVTILQDNDIAGRLVFVGADGVDFRTNLAEIRATVNGTPGANSIPSELDFMVNDGLQNDAVQKMKIDAKGVLSTASGSAVSYNAERTRNYQEGHNIVLDRAEVQTEDPTGNFDYHLMKQFIATKSGTFRMKWFAKNQSGAQYWGWLIARNYGFNTNQTPTGSDGSSGGQKMVLLDQGGSSLSNPGYFATGLDSGNSASVHNYREFNVQVTDVVPGDTIGLWMKVTNGSGGVVEGTGQDLFCKDFQVLSVSPTIETNAVLSGSIAIPDLSTSRFYIGTGDGSSKFTLLEDKDTYAALITQQQGNGKCLFLNSSASDEASNQELFRCSTDGQADRFTVYNNGKVVVNASQVHAGSSDIRVKKNITEISGSLNKLKQMRGVTFNWKTQEETTGSYDFKWNNLDTRTQYGMIAQEIETQYPELITSGSDTIKSVYYEGFIGVLVQGIKDLTTKVETLEAQMAQVSGSN